LQEKEIIRVGSNQAVPVNARIIVATHKNLLEEVQRKTFREDLYYRLYGMPIHLPPLRERNGDVLLLGQNFSWMLSARKQAQQKNTLAEAQQKLMAIAFPAMCAKLKSIVELAVVMSERR